MEKPQCITLCIMAFRYPKRRSMKNLLANPHLQSIFRKTYYFFFVVFDFD